MFKWNVEERKLTTEKNSCTTRFTHFKCEETTSLEDKIAFIDTHKEGRMTAALNLIKKYREDLASGVIKSETDFSGNKVAKTVSLKAWLAKNDTASPSLCDRDYYHGGFRGFGYGVSPNIKYLDTPAAHSTEDFVCEAFHSLLLDLVGEEEKYFHEHDEYEIAKQKLRDNKYVKHLVNLSIWSSGEIKHRPPQKEGESENKWYERCCNARNLTLEEINELLEKADELKAYAAELSKTVSLNKGKPYEEE